MAENYTITQGRSVDNYVKLHDVNWAFPNDYNYQFTIIINLPSQDGWNTNSISAAPSPSAFWPNQKPFAVGGQRPRGTCTPEIKSIATLRKILDIDITLYPNWRMDRVWGCIYVGIIMKMVAYPYLLSRFRGVVALVLHFNAFSDNSLTPWSPLPLPFAEQIPPGPTVSICRKGRKVMVNSQVGRTSYNTWYLLCSRAIFLKSNGLKKYRCGIAAWHAVITKRYIQYYN